MSPPRRWISKKKGLALFLAGISLLAGCERLQREAREEILKADPSFATLLTKKADLDAQVRSLKSNLADKRREIGERMRALQREYRVYASEIQQEIRGLQAQLDPERQSLQQQLEALKAELRIKQQTHQNLVRVQKETTRLLERADTALSAEERAAWEDKLATTNQELAALTADVGALKGRLHLLSLKLRALRQ